MAKIESSLEFETDIPAAELFDRADAWARGEGFHVQHRTPAECVFKRSNPLHTSLNPRAVHDVLLLPTTLTVSLPGMVPPRTGPPPLPGVGPPPLPPPPTLTRRVVCHWVACSRWALSIKRDINAIEEKLAQLAAALGQAQPPAATTCHECDAPLADTATFCQKCGASRTPRLREPIEIERRLLTQELLKFAGPASSLIGDISKDQTELSLRAASKFMPYDVYETDIVIAATDEAVLRASGTLLGREGQLKPEVVTALGQRPGVAALIKAGFLDFYPVIVSIRILHASGQSCKARLRGVANEDLIAQQAGHTSVGKFKADLLKAFGA